MKQSQTGRIAVYFFVLSLSLTLRLYQIGAQSYWIDEMTSLYFAKIREWQAVFSDNTPFLYNVLLRIWVGAFGNSETATRSLSVVFSVLTTGALTMFGEFAFGMTAAFFFGVLHAIYPLSILYAQETRAYAMFEFASSLNFIAFYVVWIRARGVRAYAASALLLASTHFLAIVPLGLQGAAFLFRRDRMNRRAIAGIFGAIAVLAVSWVISFGADPLDWQTLKFQADPSSRWPLVVLWDLLFASWPALIAVAFLLCRARRKSPSPVIMVILPLIGALVLGFGLRRSVFLSRYFVFLIPWIVFYVGLSLSELFTAKNKFLALTAFSLVVLGSAVRGIPDAYLPRKAPWKAVAEMIDRQPGARVFTTRTLGIQTPYFDHIGVPVNRLDVSGAGIAKVIEEARKGAPIWIVETYWGGMTYLPEVKATLEREGFDVAEKSFKTDWSDEIIAIKIQRK